LGHVKFTEKKIVNVKKFADTGSYNGIV